MTGSPGVVLGGLVAGLALAVNGGAFAAALAATTLATEGVQSSQGDELMTWTFVLVYGSPARARPDLTRPSRSRSITTMRTAAALVLVLVLTLGACSPAAPSSVQGQVIHVLNNSDRAVMVMTGSPLDDNPTTAAGPCGGEVALAVGTASYEDDGRLMAMLGIDPSGALDVALQGLEGDPIDRPETFSADPIWSDGTLAGRLPIYLTVASDLTVTESAEPSSRSTAACVPAH